MAHAESDEAYLARHDVPGVVDAAITALLRDARAAALEQRRAAESRGQAAPTMFHDPYTGELLPCPLTEPMLWLAARMDLEARLRAQGVTTSSAVPS